MRVALEVIVMETSDLESVNEVRLVGRVSRVGVERELPSGALVVGVGLAVRRAPREGLGEAVRVGVDAIDVAAWSEELRRIAGALSVDDVVEVRGALRRRFYRAGGAVASRYEVEAESLVVLRSGTVGVAG